uniref:Uncharacterized protein n=1 Tax=Nymphaea colorata TaxID=210225 RepID=A0A5K1FZD1_9MAGN
MNAYLTTATIAGEYKTTTTGWAVQIEPPDNKQIKHPAELFHRRRQQYGRKKLQFLTFSLLSFVSRRLLHNSLRVCSEALSV